MKWTGLKFKVEPSGYEEDMTIKLPPKELAKFLSRGKAEQVAMRHKDAIVIGADTIVACAGKVLGKPKDAKDAKRMLRLLSGKKHTAFTGLTVIDTKTKKIISRVSKGGVYFKKLSVQEIDAYVKSGEPLDKAGAYGMQGNSAWLIKKMEGDIWGAVGLPLYDLKSILESLGVNPQSSSVQKIPGFQSRAADKALFRV